MKIIKKYNNLSLPFKASLWFMVCTFLQKAFAMLTTPIFTRLMSTEEYGEYSVFISVTSILTVLATFNVTSVLATKGINKYIKQKEQFLTNIQFLSSCTVILFAILFSFDRDSFCEFLNIRESIIYLAIGQMMVVPAFEIWSAKKRYEYNYKKIVFFTVVYLLINTFVGITAVLVSENKGQARIISYCIVQIVMYGILYISNCNLGKVVISKEMLFFALKFNMPLIPQGLANQVLAKSDVFMIQYIQGMAYAGIYSLGYNIASLVIILTSSINNVFVPWLYQKLDKRDYVVIKEKCTYMIGGIFGMVTMMILVAPEILYFFAPKEYLDATYIIAPVTVGIALTMVYTLFVNVELYFERTMIVMIGSIGVATVNIVLNAIFIPHYGFVAAAYTTLVSYAGYVIVHFIFVKRSLNKEINIFEVYDVKKILLMSLMQIVVLLIVIYLYPYVLIRYFIVVLGVIGGGVFFVKSKKRYFV